MPSGAHVPSHKATKSASPPKTSSPTKAAKGKRPATGNKPKGSMTVTVEMMKSGSVSVNVSAPDLNNAETEEGSQRDESRQRDDEQASQRSDDPAAGSPSWRSLPGAGAPLQPDMVVLQERVIQLEQRLEQQRQHARAAQEQLLTQVAALTAQLLQTQRMAPSPANTKAADTAGRAIDATGPTRPGNLTRLMTEASLVLNRMELVRTDPRGEIFSDEAFGDDDADVEAAGAAPPPG